MLSKTHDRLGIFLFNCFWYPQNNHCIVIMTKMGANFWIFQIFWELLKNIKTQRLYKLCPNLSCIKISSSKNKWPCILRDASCSIAIKWHEQRWIFNRSQVWSRVEKELTLGGKTGAREGYNSLFGVWCWKSDIGRPG